MWLVKEARSVVLGGDGKRLVKEARSDGSDGSDGGGATGGGGGVGVGGSEPD
jgi:hypothetical protein